MKINSAQVGVGLVEVMVALVLLAVAILGYTALQGQAIKVTNESFERSQSLMMLRNIAEKIHANPSAIKTYATELNATTTGTASTAQCGLDGQPLTTLCSPTQLATAESQSIKADLQSFDFQIQMHPCPNTGGNGTNVEDNIMYSYCLIAAWGDTTPTVGSNEDSDCLSERVIKDDKLVAAGGNYYYKATCMMMEL
jgi:type IV pilus assembly protein PilV